MNKKWSDKTKFEKTVDIIAGVALFVWLLFEVLERKGTVSFASTATYICVGIICICEAISFWKVKRALSYVAIFGFICMAATVILEML